MAPILILLLFFGSIGLIWLGHNLYQRWKRQRLQALPWPESWEEILQKDVPLYSRLSQPLQKQLHGLIQVFLAEKKFEGCGGLEITESMKVIIAAQACILLLNRPTHFYPKLSTILVYPSAFVAKTVVSYGTGTFVEQEQARLGESWHQGMLVLAWDHVQHGTQDIYDGHNVVLHEFAHQLDQEDGNSNGAPRLEKGSRYVSWARHLGEVYENLRQAVAKHQPSFIDPYGATNPAEFFAVVTETFFEKAKSMKKKFPELYEELRNYYQLDPASWNS